MNETGFSKDLEHMMVDEEEIKINSMQQSKSALKSRKKIETSFSTHDGLIEKHAFSKKSPNEKHPMTNLLCNDPTNTARLIQNHLDKMFEHKPQEQSHNEMSKDGSKQGHRLDQISHEHS